MASDKKKSEIDIVVLMFTLGSAIYLACVIGLLVFNGDIKKHGNQNVAKLTFHHLEFSANMGYTVLCAVVINIYNYRAFGMDFTFIYQFVIILFGVTTSFLGFLMIIINTEIFEIPSHYLEYVTLLFLTISDISFIAGMKRKGLNIFDILTMLGSLVSMALVLACFVTYHKNEVNAHFLEFTNEIVLIFVTGLNIVMAYQHKREEEKKSSGTDLETVNNMA